MLERIEEYKPDPKRLDSNVLDCGSCGHVLTLSEHEPLAEVNCPECGEVIFVPYCVNNFWLYRVLGGGGMGRVYKAVHLLSPESVYAVKIPPRKKLEDQFIVRSLIREGEVGKQLGKNPHIVHVIDYGQYGLEHYVAMDCVDGKRLDLLIEELEKISPKYVLLWALQLLSAEQHIYDCGYLYRDLKPQNIIIDSQGNAHLFDYGLCMPLDEARGEKSGTVEGSPQYMPPERIVGAGEDMSSEIYSLGLVLFTALSGKTYYSATTAYELAKKHVSSLRLASVENRIPAFIDKSVVHLLDKMMSRRPIDRFHTFRECGAVIKGIFDAIQG